MRACRIYLSIAAAAIVFAAAPARAQFEKTPVARLPHVIVSAERIAWRVFDPKVGGVHVGRYLLRMPGGFIYLRSTPESAGEIEREFFRFAIQIKLAERQVWLKDAQKRRQLARSPHLDSAPKPLSAFFNDDTLSPGDVIVAAEGFRVFKGSANFPYKAADFVPLDRWQRNNGERKGLREMERESRRRQ